MNSAAPGAEKEQETALLKSSKNIEHPLVFEETIDGENDTSQVCQFSHMSYRKGKLSRPYFLSGKPI
jgi:hypothetical protein